MAELKFSLPGAGAGLEQCIVGGVVMHLLLSADLSWKMMIYSWNSFILFSERDMMGTQLVS